MIYAIIATIAIAFLWGSNSVVGGVTCGLLIACGLAAVYNQFPRWVKKSIVGMRLFFDFFISAGVFFLVPGGTVTGLVAAATCGLVITLLLRQQAMKRKGGILSHDMRVIMSMARIS